MNENLINAFEILYSHRDEMEHFMDFYVFKRMSIKKETFLGNENNFLSFANFCLNTAQRSTGKNIKNGLDYFKKYYSEIKKMIDNKKIDDLKKRIYSCPGIGQKIGSMMLEFIFLYSNKKDTNIAKELFVPLDTHVLRLFYKCFHMKNIPSNNNQLKINNNTFKNFQESLKQYTNNKPIIYFDYLWFIGKMFCNKINEEDDMNRGYKLCNYCWLKDCCENNEKWV